MKIACDFCERVKDADSREVKDKWLCMKVGSLNYLICEKCAEKIWSFIDDISKRKIQTEETANVDLPY